MTMLRQFVAPPLYLQGPGALDRLAEIAASLGRKPLVVTDPDVERLLGARLRAILGDVPLLRLDGEITPNALAALAEQARPLGCDVVLAVGGGKALDAGKAVARDTGARVISVPTIASNDAPTSQAIALYADDDHRFMVESLGRNPDAVLVDSLVIAAAPPRFLLSGIGDGLAKYAEAEGAAASPFGLTPLGMLPSVAGLALARAARDTIHADATAALAVAGTGATSPAFERVLEAVILLSGLGFENGGLGVAHAMTRGLILAERTKRHPHGEQVAYGLLVMLALEPDGVRLRDESAFLAAIGLPTALRDFGEGAVDDGEIRFLAEQAMTAPRHIANYGRTLDADILAGAIRRVEERQS